MLRLINVTLKPINIKERKGEILAKGGQVFANILEGGYDEYEYPEIKVFKRA